MTQQNQDIKLPAAYLSEGSVLDPTYPLPTPIPFHALPYPFCTQPLTIQRFPLELHPLPTPIHSYPLPTTPSAYSYSPHPLPTPIPSQPPTLPISYMIKNCWSLS